MNYTIVAPAVFLAAFLSIPCLGSEPVVVDDALENVDIGERMDFREDPGQKLVLKEVVADAEHWKKSDKASLNFGFATSAYWFRFSVDNRQKSERGYYFEISYPMLDFIEVYIPDGKGGYTVKKSGDHYPFYEREIVDRNFVFFLPHEPGTQTIYMRIQTTSSLNFNPVLWSQRAYLKRVNREFPLFWIYYGMMMVMIIYNLFLFVSIREARYVYYSLFITAFMLFQLTLNGFAFQYLWPNWIWWANNSLPFLMCFTCFSAGMFVRSYLDARNQFPRANTALVFFSIIPCFVWSLASLLLSYRVSIMVATFMALYSAILMYGSGAVGFVNKSRAGRYLVIAFTMLVVGVAFFVLKTFGVLPANLLTQWSIQIGSSLVVILLSLGLADEINVMKNKLEVLNTHLQDMNENLEAKVKVRTVELEKARDEIWGEMELAKKIQTVLLPVRPAIHGYEISAVMLPAANVGGDYYDIINVDNRDWLIIGDVSGHGVPAGIIMMMVQTSIHTAIIQNPDLSPSQLLTVINRTITRNIRQLNEDKYMTMTVFACHSNGAFNFSGLHQDIMIYRAGEQRLEVVGTDGFWIGITEDVTHLNIDSNLQLEPGDCMLIYTDGITEAWKDDSVRDERSPLTDMYGNEHLQEVFRELGTRAPDDIKQGILDSLCGYQCVDDVTLVVMKRVS